MWSPTNDRGVHENCFQNKWNSVDCICMKLLHSRSKYHLTNLLFYCNGEPTVGNLTSLGQIRAATLLDSRRSHEKVVTIKGGALRSPPQRGPPFAPLPFMEPSVEWTGRCSSIKLQAMRLSNYGAMKLFGYWPPLLNSRSCRGTQ